jgi:hypothetical protein
MAREVLELLPMALAVLGLPSVELPALEEAAGSGRMEP